jgi:hypothetical protein
MSKISETGRETPLPYNPTMERVLQDAYSRGIGVFTTTLMEDGKVSVRRIPIEDYAKGPQDANNI